MSIGNHSLTLSIQNWENCVDDAGSNKVSDLCTDGCIQHEHDILTGGGSSPSDFDEPRLPLRIFGASGFPVEGFLLFVRVDSLEAEGARPQLGKPGST